MTRRLTQAQAIAALDAIQWTSDRVTYRDVIHQANVVLWRYAPPSVQAAFERLVDRCNQRFAPPEEPE